MNRWRKPKRGPPADHRNPLDELGNPSQPLGWLLNDLKSVNGPDTRKRLTRRLELDKEKCPCR